MGETITFLVSIMAIVYALYWFWKNDDGLGAWNEKKPFDPNHDNDQAPR